MSPMVRAAAIEARIEASSVPVSARRAR